ncbi:indole-3-acetaldehyde oxidase-like [Zingiber officinale]|uniref:indole-3-acetaldehyde oxidase-like n=1 Tax=Zingiber officinale TaxID=94328 RepID=UPI001C4AF840|nr:indole-3-acetaldehyde oxidase-like [Zingiber officinale]
MSRNCSLKAKHVSSGVSVSGEQFGQSETQRGGPKAQSSQRQQKTTPLAEAAYGMHGQEHSVVLVENPIVFHPSVLRYYSSRRRMIATACALTAFKLRHPIKMYLDRSTDMVMVGGRHPMKITYSVGFKSDGKITALYLNLLVNAGISEDYSPLISHAIITCLKKYNWGALAFDIKLCKTNLTSKSSMRAPGQVQGSYIAEAIIERVASFLSLDVDVVRKRNLHTYESLKFFYGSSSGEAPEYTLPAIVDELFTSASYFNRLEMVLHFNSCNKWKKRGISWVPIVYEVEPMPTPGKVSILNDGSIVVEVGGIEIGQGLWTKVKQMAAFGLEQ